MNFKKILFLLICLPVFIMLLSGCGKKSEPVQPTEEVFLPTRSVATVQAPTKGPTCNNVMGYINDVNYIDGTVVAAGTKFVKEWEVINYSDCNWDDKYHLFFISGNQMGAPDFIEIPHIPIGAKGKISVEMTAPAEPGEYRSEWKLFGADNRFFGESLTLNIVVE